VANVIDMTQPARLVVGCSEQLPDQLRAYHVMGTASAGCLLLSRYGVTYSAAAEDVSSYDELLERMLGKVLDDMPAGLRNRARARLVKRWNSDWGVSAEDLDVSAMDPANQTSRSPSPPTNHPTITDDERVDQAGLGSFPASDPPPWTSGRGQRPDVDDPDGGDNRDRERRRHHLDA
jgi:hypothetical protein